MVKKLPIELKGLGISILIGVLLCSLASTVVYYTGLKETLLNPLAKLVLVISVFSGSCVVSRTYGNKGLVRGVSLGIMFFILMLIITLISSPSHIDIKGFLYTLTACIVSGGLGGILGIGLSEG
jgi:putative membrane protein (TIGR04086 family)